MGLLEINGPMDVKTSVKVTFLVLTGVYMATGVAALVTGGYFTKTSGESRRVVIMTDNVLRWLFAAGCYIIINASIGFIGSLAPLRRKRWLQIHIWLTFLAVLVESSVGIWLWTRTLDINGFYAYNWRNLWADSVKQIFQDSSNCCGYMGPGDSPVMASASCQNLATAYGCKPEVQKYAQSYLAYVYSCLFSFVILDIAAMLAAMVLLVLRNDEERWRCSTLNSNDYQSPPHPPPAQPYRDY
ncbi:hypothetical protein GQ54DRAFT_88376 [Martensiomyces pterosporus]|nr:hypothetical protein GQ54DRAFT_88376 [Martensiomyces pterosporus]